MNKLFVGYSTKIELPNRGGFLFIDDEVPDIRRARVFNPTKCFFNPLKGLTHVRARELANVLYTTTPQGENTLTVRNGRRALLSLLLANKRLDKIEAPEKAEPGVIDAVELVKDILMSPVLKEMLCSGKEAFSFDMRSPIVARVNRAELGEFDSLVIGLILMNHYRGQLIIPHLEFYGRDAHVSLIRQGRLIAGVECLDDLPLRLRRAVLSIPDRVGRGVLYDDAVTLAKYSGLRFDPLRENSDFNNFVDEVMSSEE